MEIEDLTDETIDWPKGDEYIDMVRELKLNLAAKTDECELLKIKLDESNRNITTLNQELNRFKMTVFEIDEDARKNHQEFEKSKNLEEKYMKLMSDFMELGEESEQFKQNMLDKYLAKTNAINSLECLNSSGVLNHDLEKTRQNLNKIVGDLKLANARCRSLEEEGTIKDKCIKDLRKTLDDAKVTHKHEINVLEEYIQSLKNTISSYEKILTDYYDGNSAND